MFNNANSLLHPKLMLPSFINKGDFLLSLPTTATGDSVFSRSVIILAEYEEEGAIGFILNKPLDIEINSLISEINANFTIYHGGPVEQDKVFFLHVRPDLISNGVAINEHMYWGGDYDQVVHLINSKKLEKEDIRFFLGYSGWDFDQLHNEIDDNFWIHIYDNIDYKKIFLTPSQTLWKSFIQDLGKEYSIWVNAPENPDFN